ncbi:MAG: hypothetical protein L6R36_002083 [Xanthoria steineri]|nr:MAG: hypothetical protein L6R36_002083 [Xanthoria steineri]
MQIASILSDLTSLRVCIVQVINLLTTDGQDHNAALALVSTRAPASDSSTPKSTHLHATKSSHGVKDDPDLERALDLIELHQGVKMTHVQGQDQGLTQARRDVDAVLAELEELDAERASER